MWKVWVFLAPLCPICQDYTFYLNSLHEDWEERFQGEVELVGWFPNPRVTDEEIADFGLRYGIQWDLARDTVGWADGLEAKWTPEAFLLDSTGQVLFRGRINDLYYALGKHRAEPRRMDLALAVEQAMQGEQINPAITDAIGCPIEKRLPYQDSLARVIFLSGLNGL
jgi:hypothetical protein